ncbi:ThuA domain-containing protein, partial [Streptomyces sp.]|uniref:ThuA domain-containing protein n=1 Tax=Streptomyces sp. TaxID=1931 RepID=UPI0039C91CAC
MAGFASALLASASLALVATQTSAAPAADDAAAAADQYQIVTLAKGNWETGEPMSLAVLPDRSVLHTSREGTLRLTNAAGETKFSGQLDVYTGDEEGLQGVGVDPDFKNNRAIYLYYAPPLDTPEGEAPAEGSAKDFESFETDKGYRLSRFVLKKDGTLDKKSEKKVLDVPASRGTCCHVGGDIDFDKHGNLYLSTGDDTNPHHSDKYTPIDERTSSNPAMDAQRTAANTNDLRGKILRIKVADDGSYTIPKDNLFDEAKDTKKETLPEIYAMGFRNPFRMSVDKVTGYVYLGDYGPDADSADSKRGPAGTVEFNRVTERGNYGWPYCVGKNEPFIDYNFAKKTSGKAFNCNAPKNDSPRNTGREDLPPTQPAWISYSGGSMPEFGNSSQEGPMAGPVYRYDAGLDSPVKFPKDFDGDFFAGEFTRNWIKTIEHGDGADGTIESIKDFPWAGRTASGHVMDMAFGPDGALYVLDYGTSYFGGDHNSALYRIENTAKGHTPDARAKVDKTSGKAPLKVSFSSEGTSDADGDKLTYVWDFGDGGTSTEPNPKHTYQKNGTYTARVTVKDDTGRANSASLRVNVPAAPTLKLTLPSDGKLFEYGDEIPFKVETTGTEDEKTRCSKVEVNYVLGHNEHGHVQASAKGCEGTLKTSGHGDGAGSSDKIFGKIAARYNLRLPSGEPYISDGTKDEVRLQPKHWQAEHFDEGFKGSHDVKVVDHAPAHGGKTVGFIHNGSWVAYKPYDLGDATKLTARVSSAGAGGTLEVRSGSSDGKLLGSAKVPVTGSWEKFTDVSTNLTNPPAGTTTLYLVFKGVSGKALFDVDDFTIDTSTRSGIHAHEGKVLAFTKAAGFKHSSRDEGVAAIKELGEKNGFTVDATEDAGSFTKDKLSQYDAVVFLSTTGDVLNKEQQTAFEEYVKGGGGYVGVHSAADTEYDWPFYGGLVGAYFKDHPRPTNVLPAKVNVEDRAHPSTAHLGETWERTDEWYGYKTNPRERVHVLATLDESSYAAGNSSMGDDHPIAWCQDYQGGRSFYTGGGHTEASYKEGAFRAHLLGGIQYARGAAQADCRPEQGYSSLFGGSGTDGWKQAGPGSFALDKAAGTLKSVGGMGLLWYEKKQFNSYSLKL